MMDAKTCVNGIPALSKSGEEYDVKVKVRPVQLGKIMFALIALNAISSVCVRFNKRVYFSLAFFA